jgi:hypothetical protein
LMTARSLERCSKMSLFDERIWSWVHMMTDAPLSKMKSSVGVCRLTTLPWWTRKWGDIPSGVDRILDRSARNETHKLSLMPQNRVNSGTAPVRDS